MDSPITCDEVILVEGTNGAGASNTVDFVDASFDYLWSALLLILERLPRDFWSSLLSRLLVKGAASHNMLPMTSTNSVSTASVEAATTPSNALAYDVERIERFSYPKGVLARLREMHVGERAMGLFLGSVQQELGVDGFSFYVHNPIDEVSGQRTVVVYAKGLAAGSSGDMDRVSIAAFRARKLLPKDARPFVKVLPGG